MKIWKKVLALILALAMVIPGVYLGKPGNREVQAAAIGTTVMGKDYVETWDSTEVVTNYLNVSKDKRTAPEAKADYLFAGWFNDAGCTLDGGITKAGDIAGEKVYAKFVPAGILSVKAQSTPDKSVAGDVMRFVSSVDTLNYSQVGFEVTYKSGDKNITKTNISNKVYRKIDSQTAGVNYEFDPKVVDIESDYFITATLDIKKDPFDGEISTDYTVKAFWETLDGTRVRGAGRCVSVEDCRSEDTISLSFELKDGVAISNNKLQANGVDVVSFKPDGTTVYVKVKVDKSSLKSATTYRFTTEGDAVVGSTIYRNLYTDYSKGGADDTWYTEYQAAGATEFTIATSADLYGLANWTNTHKTSNFKDMTIYMVADIKVNDGDASDWAEGENLPDNKWIPIGGGENGKDFGYSFAGTFDGQMHTVRGLYTQSDGYYIGLFGALATDGSATVKNLKLENSYFKSIATDVTGAYERNGVGSIAGFGFGTLDTIYSDVILESQTRNVGGLVGSQTWDSDAKLDITNCWFKGSAEGAFWIGGIVGFIGNVKYTNISNCLVTADLTSNGTSGNASYVGGITGRVVNGTIDSCAVIGTLTGTGTSINGIFGMNSGSTMVLAKCYNATDRGNNVPTALRTSEIQKVSEGDLKGVNAYTHTLLDFYVEGVNEDGRWVAIKNDGLIGLKSFTDEDQILNLSIDQIKGRVLEADTKWYDDHTADSEYIIMTENELLGLAKLSNEGNGIRFTGKTVKLGADLKLNLGLATDWTEEKNRPVNTWTPIGGGTNSNDNKGFAGTFDGQMHTVSGLYTKSDGTYIGMFGYLNDDGSATIKNLKLTNSYFECTRTTRLPYEQDGVGSIAGHGAGKLNTIYSDAIVVNAAGVTGGLIGCHRTATATMDVTKCWFDGKVKGTFLVGGILGFNAIGHAGVNISDCLVTADLQSVGTFTDGNSYVGGIGGRISSGTVNSCVVIGTLTGVGGAVNGICGIGNPSAPNCYNATNCAGNGASNANRVSEVDLKGANALENARSLFYSEETAEERGVWVIIEGSFPILKSFAPGK